MKAEQVLYASLFLVLVIVSANGLDLRTVTNIDCDSFFKHSGNIEEHELEDVSLKDLFLNRNASFKSCLDFYVKYFSRLENNELDKLLNESSEENVSSYETGRLKRKSSFRRKPSKSNKAF